MATKAIGNKNAVTHGVYVRDIVAPGESRDEFQSFLNAVHQDLNPQGVLEIEVADEIGILLWQKRRLRRWERENYKSAKSLERLSEAMSSIAAQLSGEKTLNFGKVGANLRGAANDIDEILSRLKTNPHQFDDEIQSKIAQTELEARLDGLHEKKLRRLIMLKEYRRLYGDPAVPLIEHRPTTGAVAPSTLLAHAPRGTRVGSNDNSSLKNDDKTNEDNDDDDDDDNNNGNLKPRDFDWEDEYDAYQGHKAAKQDKT